MQVSNIINSNGNKVANQFFIIDDKGNEFFQSYESIIVKHGYAGGTFLDAHTWNYSRTTSRYRSQFLNESTKETQTKIDSGEYILTNLN